jgi:4-aminobutyrate aminotransferase-like enzyme
MKPFGSRLPRLVTTPPGPRSRELARRLARVESQNVTYLSTDFPVFWEAAHGANVRDVDGNEYVDVTGAFGVAAAGHTPEQVAEVVAQQGRLLVHGMGDIHPAALKVLLLERLAEIAPWKETRTVLASSGSEAVEAALKTAALAAGHPGVVAFEGSYHGLTVGSLAATSREHFRGPFEKRLYPGVAFVPFPVAPGSAVEEALGRLAAVLADGVEDAPVGAVIVEPIQGRAGVRIPPTGFLAEVARLTRASGAVLIFDEIFTGLGRTGRMFAFEHEGVIPDLLCIGKSLGGGLPLSACLGSKAVMDAWPESSGEAIHTSTFLGHPLSCAAALAFLSLLEECDLPGRSRTLGDRALTRLREGLDGNPYVAHVRGRGLFTGVELSSEGLKGVGGGSALTVQLLKSGLLILPAGDRGHVLELTPPFTITEEQLEFAVDAVIEALEP